ncbi:MAG: T9SS type A sorting domain-containing protein [Flavobacteriia bacterium]|nr:T9SS type A sorting domain-containing protein [Flavobacteriia bacterium]
MSKSLRILPWVLSIFAVFSAEGREIPGLPSSSGKMESNKSVEELCQPAQAQSDLNINNVRATILGGGDMWWDLNQARYEVPKGSNRHSMFAGALWLGGVDEGNQLKLAAMTYRQRGNDYWPGPLSTDGLATVTKDVCDRYDRHWIIYRSQVDIHKAWLECQDDPDCDAGVEFPGYESNIPDIILNWPAHGVDGELPYRLAPFIDRDGDELYDPYVDYPAYDIDRAYDCQLKDVDLLYGDQTIWWVYNDRGNVHSETQAGALGFEIRAQAFAFTTNDEINNMTFNNYRIINKSTFRLTNTYFSTWFDPDLGFAQDDIIGCDIPRGLGYCYNSDFEDEGPFGYGEYPPAVGFDFFQGPFADYFDGRDNDRDGCVDGVRDENGNCVAEDPSVGRNERIIMSGFMYYNNTGDPASGNPNSAAEFYNYMRSRWKNGNPLVVENPSGQGNTSNGDGYTPDGSGLATLFAYPGNTFDTTGVTQPTADQNWFESPSNQEDKRGLHNAGPFSLAPGALNFITTGVVWERNFQTQNLFASVEEVIIADDKAQQLFDNCFQVLNGPDAPDVELIELNEELVLTLNYSNAANNVNLDYREKDPLIPVPPGKTEAEVLAENPDYFDYRFEGFQIFQLANENVSIADRYDPAQAQLIAQCDIRNGVTQLVNWELDPDINQLVPSDMTLTSGNDGIQMSFSIKEDAFATSTKTLRNHREYYFTVIAYAVNEFEVFDPFSSPDGQRKPFLAGRNNIRTYTGIPHRTEAESGGQGLNADYGDGIEITRIEGVGNSGIALDFNQDTEDEIVRDYNAERATYTQGAGPVNVKIVDPRNVPAGNYTMKFNGVDDFATWELYTSSDTVLSRRAISFLNEQIIPELGISVTVENVRQPGDDTNGVFDNGIILTDISFTDPTAPWLTGVADNDTYTPFNWILAGTNTNATEAPADIYPDQGGDPKQFFETMVGGTWGPFYYASQLGRGTSSGFPVFGMGPADSVSAGQRYPIRSLHSIDVVYTDDATKWTRVPVFEMGEDPNLTEGGAEKLTLRQADGWSLNNGQLVRDASVRGWSYFPGYAIDLETGQRLNMAFGENSWMVADRGNDMLWNPTSTVAVSPGDNITGGFRFGGQHYLYVFAPSVIRGITPNDISYKGDDPTANPMYSYLNNLNTPLNKREVFKGVMYANIPLVTPSFHDMDPYTNMPSEVRTRIRMNRPYDTYQPANTTPQNGGNPLYEFSTTNFATDKNNLTIAENELENIRVVPNPYYARSAYETSQLESTVKITNLPQVATISIFSANGTMIRQINKNNSSTWLTWDLTNDYGVPIASGVYIIHVDAPGIGEHILKWYGALRPVDLNAF